MNFYVAILILKVEENKQHIGIVVAFIQQIWHIMLYYFMKGKNSTETQKRSVQYMEKVL